MTEPELLDDFLCPCSPASLDQNEISGRGDLTQKFGGFRCRLYCHAFFQTGVFCGLGDCRGYISNCNQMIDF